MVIKYFSKSKNKASFKTRTINYILKPNNFYIEQECLCHVALDWVVLSSLKNNYKQYINTPKLVKAICNPFGGFKFRVVTKLQKQTFLCISIKSIEKSNKIICVEKPEKCGSGNCIRKLVNLYNVVASLMGHSPEQPQIC